MTVSPWASVAVARDAIHVEHVDSDGDPRHLRAHLELDLAVDELGRLPGGDLLRMY
jgi:hypothetical protein